MARNQPIFHCPALPWGTLWSGLFALGMLGSLSAEAATYSGGDWGGSDLVLADGDHLVGTFTNVGHFYVLPNALVTVEPGVPLIVEAETIFIDGVLDASGAGHPGGAPTVPSGSALNGVPGAGLGGGGGGLMGDCVHPGGGGGGGFVGAGGKGGTALALHQNGGFTYNPPNSMDQPMRLGSGGGGGGTGCHTVGHSGGDGGGAISLTAVHLDLLGAVDVSGAPGESALSVYDGAGGGGSGGHIRVITNTIYAPGMFITRGGAGGDGGEGSGYQSGGGGGGGGLFELYYGTTFSVYTSRNGGAPGMDEPDLSYPAEPGEPGDSHFSKLLDSDFDGVADLFDPCTGASNIDEDGDGFCSDLDCDDFDPSVYPGAPEVCDGVDNDCNGLADDEDPDVDPATQIEVWPDHDLDGFGADNLPPSLACGPSPGWVTNSSDCDDTDPDVFPGALEVCDDIDNDCNGLIDDEDPGVDPSTMEGWWPDNDLDGFGASGASPLLACDPGPGWALNDLDCDDADSAVHPAALEVCDGIDNDCNWLIDEDDPNLIDALPWWPDLDGDDFGDGAEDPFFACEAPVGWVDNDLDCDDTDPAIHPYATEVCDGEDNDCNGLIDEEDPDFDHGSLIAWWLDLDGDGFGTTGTLPQFACDLGANWVQNDLDCDDFDPAVNPNAPEVCDGIDNNCSGYVDDEDPNLDPLTTPVWWPDADLDGFGDASTKSILACIPEPDWVSNGLDCDDTNPLVHPAAQEVCDGIDNNCNGRVDDADPTVDLSTGSEWWPDADGDGWGDPLATPTLACDPAPGFADRPGDCDDTDASAYPGAPLAGDDCDRPSPDPTDFGAEPSGKDAQSPTTSPARYGLGCATLPGHPLALGWVALLLGLIRRRAA